jgi:hypothetical protein
MNRDVAAQLIKLCVEMGDILNRATKLVGSIADAEEQKLMRRPIGELGADVYTKLMRPLIQQYPDLDPDK